MACVFYSGVRTAVALRALLVRPSSGLLLERSCKKTSKYSYSIITHELPLRTTRNVGSDGVYPVKVGECWVNGSFCEFEHLSLVILFEFSALILMHNHLMRLRVAGI